MGKNVVFEGRGCNADIGDDMLLYFELGDNIVDKVELKCRRWEWNIVIENEMSHLGLAGSIVLIGGNTTILSRGWYDKEKIWKMNMAVYSYNMKSSTIVGLI